MSWVDWQIPRDVGISGVYLIKALIQLNVDWMHPTFEAGKAMAQEELDYTVPANTSTNTPAISVNAILTINDTANPDGSFTITDISGTRGSDVIIGLESTGTDSSDNEIFLSGSIVDGQGFTYITNGAPTAAGGGSSADVNFSHPVNTSG